MKRGGWKDRALRAERLKKRYFREGDRFLAHTRAVIAEREQWRANAVFWHGQLKKVAAL